MFKIFGNIIILLSCTSIGLLMAWKYKVRVRQLKEIRGIFQLIETEIFYTATPILEVLEKVARQASSPIASIFKEIIGEIKRREGKTLGRIWCKAFERGRENTGLTKEDLVPINYFGNILGTSDQESQIKNGKLVQSQLIKLEEGAEKDFIRNEKLFKNLGVLLGLTIVIILY
ncbi:MAG TPA: hypothetical protein GXZ78_04010 [Eubacteriaceae bacterium]|nr:hypothetical protein [Eubacteriaceae bacterium]